MANALSPPLTAFKFAVIIRRSLVLQQEQVKGYYKGNANGPVEL